MFSVGSTLAYTLITVVKPSNIPKMLSAVALGQIFMGQGTMSGDIVFEILSTTTYSTNVL